MKKITIIIAIILLLMGCSSSNGDSEKNISDDNSNENGIEKIKSEKCLMGNSLGNTLNGGKFVGAEDFIIFWNYADDGYLYKMDIDGKNLEKIYAGEHVKNGEGLKYWNSMLYFQLPDGNPNQGNYSAGIEVIEESENTTSTIEYTSMYRITDVCSQNGVVMVLNRYVYFLEDGRILRGIDTGGGTNFITGNDVQITNFIVTPQFIYYTTLKEDPVGNSSGEILLNRMTHSRIQTTVITEFDNNSVIDFYIFDEVVYFIKSDEKTNHSTLFKLTDGEKEKLVQEDGHINAIHMVDDLFYYNLTNSTKVTAIDLNGQVIKEFETQEPLKYFHIIGDHIYGLSVLANAEGKFSYENYFIYDLDGSLIKKWCAQEMEE